MHNFEHFLYPLFIYKLPGTIPLNITTACDPFNSPCSSAHALYQLLCSFWLIVLGHSRIHVTKQEEI